MKSYVGRTNVYIIAEIGVNHDGSLENAKKLVDLAKASGADAVKFQSFKAEDLATTNTPKVEYQDRTIGTEKTHYDMLRELELTEEEESELFHYCNAIGINFISTPYSVSAVRHLNKIGVKEFKVASADIVDIPLLREIASTRKPVILSLGMASLGEIEQALNVFSEYDDESVVLLHCISNYPCSDASINLRALNTLISAFGRPVGFSDHSIGPLASTTSIALGACVIEKHFTSNKELTGPDHSASSTPDEFLDLVQQIRRVEVQLGSEKKEIQPEELSMKKNSRKSLVYARDIAEGDEFKVQDFTMKRPGDGLNWESINFFIGRKARGNIKKNFKASVQDIS